MLDVSPKIYGPPHIPVVFIRPIFRHKELSPTKTDRGGGWVPCKPSQTSVKTDSVAPPRRPCPTYQTGSTGISVPQTPSSGRRGVLSPTARFSFSLRPSPLGPVPVRRSFGRCLRRGSVHTEFRRASVQFFHSRLSAPGPTRVASPLGQPTRARGPG